MDSRRSRRRGVTRLHVNEKDILAGLNARHGLWRDEQPALLARGAENTTVAVGDLIVRLASEVASTAREASLLALLGQESKVAVPKLIVAEPEHGVLVYQRLRGDPLIHNRHLIGGNLDSALVELLRTLRRITPRLELAIDEYPNRAWHRDAIQDFLAIRSQIGGVRESIVRTVLDKAPPPDRTTVSLQHNDLGIEHILVDNGGDVTGVIDWTDAVLADPARDLGLIYRDLGPEAALRIGAAVDGHVADEETVRVRFHAQCKWLEDARFAYQNLQTRGAYLRNADQTFAHTFTSSA